MSAQDHTPVLVVGAGLTGLSAAVFLRRLDVPVIVVERHREPLRHPRARTVNPRTLELYRQAGLADAVLAARNDNAGGLMVIAETMTGPERFRQGDGPGEDAERFSPCPWVPIDQDRLETVLRNHAERLGADVRFGTELVSFEQDAHRVRAVTRDVTTGDERRIEASYLIAADGFTSPVRRRLGIERKGPGLLGRTLTLGFSADLTPHLRGRQIAVCHVDHPAPGTVIVPHDGPGRWVFSTPCAPGDDGNAEPAEDEMVRMVRAAVGDGDLEVAVVPQLADGTRVLRYSIEALVADRMRDGRVFLAGDAAHTMPPVGAFGSGTGIQDIHNLAWKLAAVLHGQAGAGLLDDYEAERRPVAEFTMRQALLLMRDRTGNDLLKTGEPAAPYYAVVFGHRYDGGGSGPEAWAPEDLTGQVGTRAPHVWLRRPAGPVSTLDLYQGRATFLAGPDGAEWALAAADTARRLGVPLDVHRVGDLLEDPDGGWCRAHGLGGDGALLVRPDGFVGWRSDKGPETDPAGAVERALTRMLHLSTAAPVS